MQPGLQSDSRLRLADAWHTCERETWANRVFICKWQALVQSPQSRGPRNDLLFDQVTCASQFPEAKLVFVLYAWEFLCPGLYLLSVQVKINLKDMSEWDIL